ncbi:uncharacterized protein LOC108198076 [Daucus carota subsp. sativus]|uniref:uncharacterized protein LOC108198076 n=1 Tax=Daucus carota subsp. sativus TaxID=79200 RepID=UPI003083982E
MLLQLWAYERLLPGRPVIARGLERVWPRARAWAEPVEGRRVNPHHHVRQYRGDFDKRPRVDADIQVPEQTRPPEETPIVISSPSTTQVPDQTRPPEETPIVISSPPTIQVPDQTRHPEETPIVISSPSTTQVPDQTRPLEETPISFAESLRDNSEMDTLEDRMFDSRRRGNKDRSGDMTRPLKNRKIRWLFREWWNEECNFIWREHGLPVTYSLNWKQIQTLKPGYWVQDDVVNAYLELVKIRDFETFGKCPAAKKYFFAPSFFFCRAIYHCQDLKDHLNSKATEELAEQVAFFEQFKRQVVGPNLVDCDYAFFPACWENHWILFVVDVQKSKVSIIDSLYSESVGRSYKDMYPSQFYIMEKLLPCMLHHLDSSRFPQPKFMKVRSVTERPKQVGGFDCGVYVVKYVDAICGGIQLKNAVWDPTLDILTFRYRMAWELNRGRARHISEWGIKERLLGC